VQERFFEVQVIFRSIVMFPNSKEILKLVQLVRLFLD